MNGLTYSQKKYLFAIYKLAQNGEEVMSAEVVRLVGVSKASTATMMANLTENGIKVAHSIFTNCIIIRDFLKNTLCLDEKIADSDAVKIVVHVSEKTVNQLAEYLLRK